MCVGETEVQSESCDENGETMFITNFERTEDALFYCEMYYALPYWLKQYAEWKMKAYEAEVKAAAEKERADKAEQLLTEYIERESNWLETTALLEQAERKEYKLKEAFEHCIEEYPQWDSKEIAAGIMLDYMKNILSILYPLDKEEDNND
ncbi:hypothetical protein D3C74_312110 [compost metagenome]